MRLARGSAPEAGERQHLGEQCPYCEMTLRQAFSLVCPNAGALDHAHRIRGAFLAAVQAHLGEGCSDCGTPKRRSFTELAAREAAGVLPARTVGVEGAFAVDFRRSPVRARAVERIERILDAAEVVFVEVGYARATTNQIASRAETSIGSVYEFFGNKRAVAAALADRYLAELAGLCDEVVVDQPGGRDEIVAKVVDGLIGFSARHPGLGPLMRGCRESDELQAVGQALEAVLLEHVERIIIIRRPDLDSARRRIVAKTCAMVLRTLDEVVFHSGEESGAMVAELKLNLSAYLATALPRAVSSDGLQQGHGRGRGGDRG